MVKSEETVELVEKTVQRVLRNSTSHLSQLLHIGIATTCKTLRQKFR
jgi:ribulose kinase